MEFSYSIQVNGNIVKAELRGRLMDKLHATELIAELEKNIKEGHTKIILDLSKMDYMNSSGLNVLVNILTKARSHSGEVVISNVSGKVKELFLITKLNTLFQVTESLEEAEKVLH